MSMHVPPYVCDQAAVVDSTICGNTTVTSDAELNTALLRLANYAPTLVAWATCVSNVIFAGTQASYALNQTFNISNTRATVGLTLDTSRLSQKVNITAAQGRHFYLHRVDFIGKRLRFKGGVSTDSGGSMYVDQGSLTLTDVVFMENSATGSGGEEE
jgi:hypothetical protein